jgi:hypothetical protein
VVADRSHLRRHDLRLQRRNELLRLGEPKSEVRQASFLIALDASHLSLGHHTRPQFRHQLHPPNQLRHQTNSLPVSPEPSPIAASPQDFECSPNHSPPIPAVLAKNTIPHNKPGDVRRHSKRGAPKASAPSLALTGLPRRAGSLHAAIYSVEHIGDNSTAALSSQPSHFYYCAELPAAIIAPMPALGRMSAES